MNDWVLIAAGIVCACTAAWWLMNKMRSRKPPTAEEYRTWRDKEDDIL